MNFISCRVSFVLSYFYKSTSSCLCRDKKGKLLFSWALTSYKYPRIENTRLQCLNFTLKPALIVQIHWDFTISAVHALLLKDRETLFWFHKCPQKFISPPQTTKTFIGQFMIASHAGLFRGARISSLSTNACSTENNIPVPSTIVQSTIVKKSVDRLNMTHKLVVV